MKSSAAGANRAHLTGMYVLSASAALHNFAFWGVAALFPSYATTIDDLSEGEASEAYGAFLGASMALPLVGGVPLSCLGRGPPLVVIAFLSPVASAASLSFLGPEVWVAGFGFIALG